MFSAVARARVACVVLFFGLGSCVPALAAEPINPQGELTLAQAVNAAIRGNPDLMASGYELNAAQARIVQADLRPNPQLSLEVENFAGTGAFRGVDQTETTLSMSQVVELGGKRSLRRSAAEADLGAVTIQQRARELDVLADVTRRFIDVIVAQERVSFTAEAAALSEKLFQAIGNRVDAARSPEAERSRAQIALTRARIEQQQAQSDLRSARYALSATWGNAEPAFRSARAQLYELRSVDTLQALLRRLDESPDLTLFASESRLREAELRLARAQARPDLTFSVGARRFEISNDATLVASFSIPLPVNNRNQGAIREAQVRVTQTDAMREAARLRARSALLALYQEMTTAAQRVETLRSEGLPQAQRALDQTRIGYERGRFSFLELATAQEELLGLRSAMIDAAADYYRMLTEIERLTSAPLAQPTP